MLKQKVIIDREIESKLEDFPLIEDFYMTMSADNGFDSYFLSFKSFAHGNLAHLEYYSYENLQNLKKDFPPFEHEDLDQGWHIKIFLRGEFVYIVQGRFESHQSQEAEEYNMWFKVYKEAYSKQWAKIIDDLIQRKYRDRLIILVFHFPDLLAVLTRLKKTGFPFQLRRFLTFDPITSSFVLGDDPLPEVIGLYMKKEDVKMARDIYGKELLGQDGASYFYPTNEQKIRFISGQISTKATVYFKGFTVDLTEPE